MEQEARREGRIQATDNNAEADEESSGEYSSDIHDWEDEGYIEEQRKALQEFAKKQKEIKQNHTKKKKKKSKKKKQGAGNALGLDDDDQSASQFPHGTDNSLEYDDD